MQSGNISKAARQSKSHFQSALLTEHRCNLRSSPCTRIQIRVLATLKLNDVDAECACIFNCWDALFVPQSDYPPASSVACELGTNMETRSEAAFTRSSVGALSAAERDDVSATDHWSMQVLVCRKLADMQLEAALWYCSSDSFVILLSATFLP